MSPDTQDVAVQRPITATATDRYVASDPQAVGQFTSGEVYFRFMVDCAIDQGYITPEGASHVLNALYPEVRG